MDPNTGNSTGRFYCLFRQLFSRVTKRVRMSSLVIVWKTLTIIVIQNNCLVACCDPCTVQRRKWSPTANDPEIGPQMIPDRKWSPMWAANDPAEKRGMAWSLFSWIFSYFLFYCYINFFSPLSDELDKHEEKIFWRRKLYAHEKFILFSFDNSSEKLLEKSHSS